MQFLTEKLLQVYQDLKKVCEEILHLCDEVDEYNDLEDVECRVDSCVALISEYLESHKDDPSSGGSFTSTWVQQHAVGALESAVSGGSSGHSGQEDVTVVTESMLNRVVEDLDIPEGENGILQPEDNNNIAPNGTHGSGEISGGGRVLLNQTMLFLMFQVV